MPDGKNKKAEKKGLLEMIDDVIADLEFKINQYNDRINQAQEQARKAGAEANASGANLQIENLKKEVSVLNRQLSVSRATRDDFEQQLNRAKNDEEKKKIEDTLKTAYYMGVINENLRQRREDEILAEKVEAKIIMDTAKAVTNSLTRNEYRHITYEDVKDIANNEEFKEMYKSNPYKIDYENKQLQQDFTDFMRRRMTRIGFVASDDFKELESAFNKEYLGKADNNGYEKALPMIRNNIKIVEARLQAEQDPNVKAQLETDLEHLNEIDDLLSELAARTLQIQEKFKSGEYNFKRGNGYTKELIALGQTLDRKLGEYLLDANDRMNKSSLMQTLEDDAMKPKKSIDVEDAGVKMVLKEINEKGYKKEDLTYLLPLSACFNMVTAKVKPQRQDDETMFRINEQRKKGEMWKVFQDVQGDDIGKAKLSTRAKLEKDAIEKANRIKVQGVRSGGFLEFTATTAAAAAQNMLVFAMAKTGGAKTTQFSKEDVIKAMAIITLNQILYNESTMDYKKRVNLNVLSGYGKNSNKEFLDMAEGLAADKNFKKAVSVYFEKNSSSKLNSLKFLGKDGEVDIAKKFKGKVIKRIDKMAKAEEAMRIAKK